MKRKLIDKKSVKTLKSLYKNVFQKRSGVVKNIEKKELELTRLDKDLSRIDELIVQKTT